ncbi:ATP-binding protein [uncultured Pontibacter sp.]|uniref:ATP-binding protein n=1 Tax=uncultured Pontibacter sp. TaxID=453356 RepID=UPI00260986E1|nr:ATP-binding protein [uncultured Pontibacter sp.]
MDNLIVPAHLVVKAMRDNGYKNAAYALAELMDNSIQHGAKNVELLCSEAEFTYNLRSVFRINQIAVLDDGSGMDSNILRIALQFGNGTNLDPKTQTGIGKFGMGLPSSSISQAQRVEVWSWQSGVENSIYTYLDIDEIINQKMKEVPSPVHKPIPDLWRKAGKTFGASGTLVVWSKIDRCIWKTAQAIIDNSEFLIGRMYRKFLNEGNAKIRMAAFREANPSKPTYEKLSAPNDPIYLMSNTSCPAPYDNQAMFNRWGEEDYEIKFDVNYDNKKHEVKVRFTYAKEEARQGYNAGSKPHGKHASKNIGVSLLRADRELDLDQTWVIQYDPRERWWGAEVEFPPSLDELFGVTNNKQFANNFSELGKLNIEEVLKDGRTYSQFKEELMEENDPKALLLDIAYKIKNQLNAIRAAIKAQAKNLERSDKERHSTETSPEQVATEATEERIKEGHIGTSDKQEEKSEDERKRDVETSLEQEGVTNATEVVERMFTNNLKYQFVDSDFESHAFFSVKSRGGKILISLNTNHPAYHKLVEVLEKDSEIEGEDILRDRLQNASEGLKLLLMAWARYEDEQPDGSLKSSTQNARMDWGRVAKDFLKGD